MWRVLALAEEVAVSLKGLHRAIERELSSMRPEVIPVLAIAMLLSACGGVGGGAKVQNASAATPARVSGPADVRQPMRYRPRNAQVLSLPGLEGVIGQTEAGLMRTFGPARLEVWEGDARKLQFSGSQCVLDVYLYPGAQGRDPQATHVEARRPSDGQDVDRAACVAALKVR